MIQRSNCRMQYQFFILSQKINSWGVAAAIRSAGLLVGTSLISASSSQGAALISNLSLLITLLLLLSHKFTLEGGLVVDSELVLSANFDSGRSSNEAKSSSCKELEHFKIYV